MSPTNLRIRSGIHAKHSPYPLDSTRPTTTMSAVTSAGSSEPRWGGGVTEVTTKRDQAPQ